MSIVLVLGAGATLANAEHFHTQRRTGENPPLDLTFFPRVRSLGIQVPTELREYAQSHPYIDPFDPRQTDARAEAFFRDLFSDFQEARSGDPTVQAYEQLVTIYTRVLRETTNWLGADNRTGGPVGRLIASACSNDDAVSILTFNHDLVIENEIQKRSRLASRWCIDHGYGTFSAGVTIPGRVVDSLRRHGPRCDHDRMIRILKLHGSLNWYVRMNGRHPSPTVLSGNAAPRQISISPRRFIRTQLRSTRRAGQRGRGRTTWYTWPIVVPPVHGKEVLIRNFVPDVWTDAAAALRDATRIVFFGYSLPELDVRAQQMLQRGVHQSEATWVDIINPDFASPGRFASVLRPQALRWYPSVDDFMSADSLGST